MAYLSFDNIRIAGISACVPSNILRNEDIKWINETEQQQFVKTVGIAERRIADYKTTTADLCEASAIRLIDKLGWDKSEIEVLILCTQSPDYVLPASAIILQHKLGLSRNCMAFDINLGCSGYTYALSVISSIMSKGTIKKGLLLCGDKSSLSATSLDKSTYPLFGDAGTATALVYEPEYGKSVYQLNSNGAEYNSIIVPEGACRTPFNKDSLTVKSISPGISRKGIDLVLNGERIFDFALYDVVPSVKKMLDSENLSTSNIDLFVFHQANLLINETARKLLKIPAEKVPYSLHNYGNTSSASIPLTIVTQLRDTVQSEIKKFMLCGFGVGFSWGSAILDIGEIVCPPLIEYE